MAQYTGFRYVLDGVLGDYVARGFKLLEVGDHALVLCHENEQVASFSQEGATGQSVRDACVCHLLVVNHKEGGNK